MTKRENLLKTVLSLLVLYTTNTLSFVDRFGGVKEKARKEVDTARFGM